MADFNNLPLTLTIVTPDGKLPDILCDSITLFVCDTEKGKGGGSYGIRKGHINSVIALGTGDVTAKADGKVIFKESFLGGIAQIKNNTVKLTVTKLPNAQTVK